MQNNPNENINNLSEEELANIKPENEPMIDKLQAQIMKQMQKDNSEFVQTEEVIEETPEERLEENQEPILQKIEEVALEGNEEKAIKEETISEQEVKENKEETQESIEEAVSNEIDETEDETQEENKEIVNEIKEAPEVSQWEELSDDNSVVKKYIFYVSKDFIPYLDDLNTDERSAYINDAIQKKIDFEQAQSKVETKKKVIKHLITMVVTILLMTPLMIMFAHKAIMATFDNYKYSQENFEKLYKQRFEHDRAYMRSIQYNKEQREKLKNKNN